MLYLDLFSTSGSKMPSEISEEPERVRKDVMLRGQLDVIKRFSRYFPLYIGYGLVISFMFLLFVNIFFSLFGKLFF